MNSCEKDFREWFSGSSTEEEYLELEEQQQRRELQSAFHAGYQLATQRAVGICRSACDQIAEELADAIEQEGGEQPPPLPGQLSREQEFPKTYISHPKETAERLAKENPYLKQEGGNS